MPLSLQSEEVIVNAQCLLSLSVFILLPPVSLSSTFFLSLLSLSLEIALNAGWMLRAALPSNRITNFAPDWGWLTSTLGVSSVLQQPQQMKTSRRLYLLYSWGVNKPESSLRNRLRSVQTKRTVQLVFAHPRQENHSGVCKSGGRNGAGQQMVIIWICVLVRDTWTMYQDGRRSSALWIITVSLVPLEPHPRTMSLTQTVHYHQVFLTLTPLTITLASMFCWCSLSTYTDRQTFFTSWIFKVHFSL